MLSASNNDAMEVLAISEQVRPFDISDLTDGEQKNLSAMEMNQKNEDEINAPYKSNSNASKFSSVTLQGPIIYTD